MWEEKLLATAEDQQLLQKLLLVVNLFILLFCWYLAKRRPVVDSDCSSQLLEASTA
jgi:hypothetical protein